MWSRGLAGLATALATLWAGGADDPTPGRVDWSLIDTIVKRIELPRIPDREYRVSPVAAAGNARPAILAAIAQASAAGGGRVVLSKGTWRSDGPIHLQSRIDLHLEEGATLLFSGDPAHYLPVVKTRWEGTEVLSYSPLVYARDVEDVALTGPGTIDGNAESRFHAWHQDAQPDFVRLRKLGFAGAPLEERVFGPGTRLRPPLIQFLGARRVLLEGFTARNSPFWVNHLVYVEQATVRAIRVESHFPNNDGVDVDSSRYVLVERSTFRTGDDSVVVKSGRDLDGRRIGRPSEYVVVRDNDMGGEDGIALGSEMSGGIRYVFFTDNVLRSGASAIRFKANLDRGGTVEHVGVRRFKIGSFEKLIWFQLDYPGELGGNFPATYRDLVFEDFEVGDVGTLFEAHAPAAAPLRDVVVRNVAVASAKQPLVAENVRGLTLDNVTVAGREVEAPAAPPAAGTYRNPVLFADYSDPDVVRVGDDYYMTASSFQAVPGLPILHSRDLVSWTLVGHAAPRLPSPDFDRAQHGNGLWAPSLRHHDGWFWIYVGDPDRGVFMTRARDPRGPWEPLTLVQEARGWIDPCPLWDDDGSVYLVHAWAKSRAGFNGVLTVRRLSADGRRVIGEGTNVFDGRDRHPTIEGPKLHKRGGWYYIFAPAGGVKTGWQSVLRSRSVLGPYEDAIVLAQGATAVNGPHQGAWVDTASGEDWFLHFQDQGAYGRIVHLQPMAWRNDWPVIGEDRDGDGRGEPVPEWGRPRVASPPSPTSALPSDAFDGPRLALHWQWHGNPSPQWASLTARPGFLRLAAVPHAGTLWSATHLLLQKLPAPAFTATAGLDPRGLRAGERAGLVVMGTDYALLAVERTAQGFRLVRVTARAADRGGAEVEEESVPVDGTPLHLRVSIAPQAIARFASSSDGRTFQPRGAAFLAQPGRWIGAKVGLVASAPPGASVTGHVDVDAFTLEPQPAAIPARRPLLSNAHREGGDFAWFADNLHLADGAPRDEDITAAWTFGGRWNPETLPPALPYAAVPAPEDGWRWADPGGVTLRWTAGRDAKSHRVFFGPEDPPAFRGEQLRNTFDTGALVAGTTYHWRIDTVTAHGVVPGRPWSFRARPAWPFPRRS
jgi:beta-xylosidase